MAKNISLLGADYPAVPAVQLPQTGGGTATFYDINVVDDLNSTSTTDALSANQGRVLKEGRKFQIGDSFATAGANIVFRTLANLSGVYFSIRLPKDCDETVTGVNVQINSDSAVWFVGNSGISTGKISSGATAGNVSLNTRRTVNFSVPVSFTIPSAGLGVASLNAVISFS